MTDERSFNNAELRNAFELLRQNFFQRVDYDKNSATPSFNANPASEQKTSVSSTPGVKEPPKSTPSAQGTPSPAKQSTSPKETRQTQPATQETQLGGKQPEKIIDGYVYRYDPDFVCFGKQGWYVAYRYSNGNVVPYVLKQTEGGVEITYPAFSWKTTNPNAGKVETIEDYKANETKAEAEAEREEVSQPKQTAEVAPQASPDEPTPGIVKILGTLKVAGEESYSKVKGIYDPSKSWVTWNQSPNEFASAKNEWTANNFLEGFSSLAREIARMRRAGRSTDDITALMRTATTNATEILRTAHGSEGGYEALSKYSQVLGTDLTKAKRAVEVRNAIARRVNDLGRMSVKELEEYAGKAHATFFANRNAARNPWILEEQAAANKEFGSVEHFVDVTQNFTENDYEAIKNAVANNETLSSSPVLAGVKTALTQALESEGIRTTDEKRSFLDTDGSRDYFNDELTSLYNAEQVEASLLAKSSEVKGTETYRKFIDAARGAKERSREKLAKAIGRAAVAWRDRLGVVDETAANRTSALPEPVPPSTPLYDRAYLNNGYSFATLDELSVDPARFQFKQDVNKATGAGAALQGVKTFNPELSSVLLVWHDPADNRDYVVNGHHRFDLARRAEKSGQPKITLGVQFINAKDAREAKTIGALANLSEQHASVIDAAVFLRHNAHDEESLLKIGLPKDQGLIKEAKSLANLSNAVFNRLEAAGEDAVPGANAISEILGLPTSTGTFHNDEERRIFERDRTNAEELQKQTWDFLASKDKLDDYDFAVEAAREFRDAESKSLGFDLFGNEINESTATDKIEAKARISKELKNRVRAHHLGRAGKSYAREGGVEEAAKKEAEAQKVLTEYLTSRLNARDDAINNVVRKASDDYAKATSGEERKRIIQTAGDDIERIVAGGNEELLGGSQTTETSGSVATDSTNGRENSDGENKPSSNVDDGAPSLLEEPKEKPKEEKEEQRQEAQPETLEEPELSLFDAKEDKKEARPAKTDSASLFDVETTEDKVNEASEALRQTESKPEEKKEASKEEPKPEPKDEREGTPAKSSLLFEEANNETQEEPKKEKQQDANKESSSAQEELRQTSRSDPEQKENAESTQQKEADASLTPDGAQLIRDFFSARPDFFEYVHDSDYFKERASRKEFGKKRYAYNEVVYELSEMLKDLRFTVDNAYTLKYLESTGVLNQIDSLQSEVSKISSLKKLDEARKKIAAFFDKNFAQEKRSLLNDGKAKTNDPSRVGNDKGEALETSPLIAAAKKEAEEKNAPKRTLTEAQQKEALKTFKKREWQKSWGLLSRKQLPKLIGEGKKKTTARINQLRETASELWTSQYKNRQLTGSWRGREDEKLTAEAVESMDAFDKTVGEYLKSIGILNEVTGRELLAFKDELLERALNNPNASYWDLDDKWTPVMDEMLGLSQTSDSSNQGEKTKLLSSEEALRQTPVEEDKAKADENLSKAREELRTSEAPKQEKPAEKQKEVYNDEPAFSFAAPSFAENASTNQSASVRKYDSDSLKKEFQQSKKETKTETTPSTVAQNEPLPESKTPQTESVDKQESKKKKRNKANRSLKNRDSQEGDAADLWLKQMEASLQKDGKESSEASNAAPQVEPQPIKQPTVETTPPKNEQGTTKKRPPSKKTQSKKTSRKHADVLECIETGDLNGLPAFKDASKNRVEYAAGLREWAIRYTLSPYRKPAEERKRQRINEIKETYGDEADAESLLREVVAKRVYDHDDVNWWIEHKTEIEKGLLSENPIKTLQEIQSSSESLQDEYSRRVRAFNEKIKEKDLSKEEKEALAKEEDWLWETRGKLRPLNKEGITRREEQDETSDASLDNIDDIIEAEQKADAKDLQADIETSQSQERLNQLLETLRETAPEERAAVTKQFFKDAKELDDSKDKPKEEEDKKEKEPKPRYSSKDDAGKIDVGMLPRQVVEAIRNKFGSLGEGVRALEGEGGKKFMKWYNAKNASFENQGLTTTKGIWGTADGYASFLEKRSGRDLYDYGRKDDIEQAIKEAQERKDKKAEDANAKQEEALERLRKSGNVSEDKLDALRLAKKTGDKLTDEEKQKISMNNPSYNERIVQSIKKGDSTQALRHSIAFMQEITKANKGLYDDVLHEVDPDFESDDQAKADGSLRGRIQKAIMRASNKKSLLDEYVREVETAKKQGTERRQTRAEKELAEHIKEEQKNKAHASVVAQDKQGVALFAKQEELIDEVDRLHRELIRRVRDAVHKNNPARETKEARINQLLNAVRGSNAEPEKKQNTAQNKGTSKKQKQTPSAMLFDKEKYSLEEAREFLRLMC